MFLLSKLLPLFVLPLGISLMLIGWGLARQKRRPVLAGLAVLLLASQPFVGRYLIRVAEGFAEQPAVASVASADAIVVLSAGRVLAPGPARVSEWTDVNRFFGGIDLYKANRAPLLIFTGARRGRATPSEGELLAAHAQALGVREDAIVVTPYVSNTADEARETAAVLRARGIKAPRIILVTSAFHLPRARELFSRQGVDVVPFPVSFARSADKRVWALDFFPSVVALDETSTALREFYGRAFYWLRARLR